MYNSTGADTRFQKMSAKACSSYKQNTYSILAFAQWACMADRTCKGVYADICDKSNGPIYLCPTWSALTGAGAELPTACVLLKGIKSSDSIIIN